MAGRQQVERCDGAPFTGEAGHIREAVARDECFAPCPRGRLGKGSGAVVQRQLCHAAGERVAQRGDRDGGGQDPVTEPAPPPRRDVEHAHHRVGELDTPLAIGTCSAWKLSSSAGEARCCATSASFQPRLKASCSPVLRPCPPAGVWMCAASPATSTLPFRMVGVERR